MTDHKAPPIAGYQDISGSKLFAVNLLKEAEERALRLLDVIEGHAPLATDRRWMALARTQIQQGFMAAVRGVLQPQRIKLPGDEG